MDVNLLFSEISTLWSQTVPYSATQNHFGAFHDIPSLELASICINLTLFLVFLFIVSARQLSVCVGRVRVFKEDSNVNSSPVRRVGDGEFRSIEIGTGFKVSLICCFYVLLLQVLVFGFDGVGWMRNASHGEGTNWTLFILPASQGLAWFVLSFSALHCKFNAYEKYPFLLRVWWIVSFVICLVYFCTQWAKNS